MSDISEITDPTGLISSTAYADRSDLQVRSYLAGCSAISAASSPPRGPPGAGLQACLAQWFRGQPPHHPFSAPSRSLSSVNRFARTFECNTVHCRRLEERCRSQLCLAGV